MTLFKHTVLILLGLGSGVIISGAVFAFISIIGVVPRLAQKTKTQKHIKFYEEAITFGGIFGSSTMMFDYYIPIPKIIVALIFACVGIFYGSLAVSLAEILDVIPILTRRTRLQRGIALFILALAFGKLAGSLMYFLIPGFYK